MLELSIGNSVSQLQGLNREEYAYFRELLSYEAPDNYFAGRHRSNKRFLITKNGAFPTGLLPLVENNPRYKNILTKDLRVRPPVPKTPRYRLHLTHVPYQSQLAAVDACVKHERGTVSMATGTGKTLVMALLIAKLQLKTLVVVPTVELKRQLSACLAEWVVNAKGNIVVENIDSPRLKTLTGFDVLIIDESHHVAAKTYRNLNIKSWGGIYYRFFFTATPFRSQDEEQMLFESVAGQVIYRLGYKDAVRLGHIAPVEAYAIGVPKKEPMGDTWSSVYKSLVVENEPRNRIIAETMFVLAQNKTPTLVLVREIAHGEKLSQLTGIPFASGQNGEVAGLLSMFNSREITMLIGTVGALGEGVDTRPCEYVVLCGLGKAKSQFMQMVGRAVRKVPGKESAKVLIFDDKSHKFTRSHFRAQCSILQEEYGVQVVKL